MFRSRASALVSAGGLRRCAGTAAAPLCVVAAGPSPLPAPSQQRGWRRVALAPSRDAFVPTMLCSRAWASGRAPPTSSSGGGGAAGGEDVSMSFEYDPMAGVQHDAAVETAKKSFDSVLEELLPDGAPAAAVEKARVYLQQHPVDSLITAAQVQITHLENPETGAEERASLSPVPLAEALEQAGLRRMNLVQMGAREDVAFCRIRHEAPWVLKLIEPEMAAEAERLEQEAAAAGGRGRQQQQRGGRGSGGLKGLTDHVFRDVVDAHFVGWRSKKICEDIQKGHPVKLTIRDFQSAESAIHKLREMSNAMRRHAEEKNIYHHFTSIVGNDREASVTFSPATANKAGQVSKTVKHPGEKEWAHALRRMQDACKKAGRVGTYAKAGTLKPRNVGSTMYRTDKYGRRVE